MQNNKNRHIVLDSLKGIGIIFVVITHCAWSDEERLALLFPFFISMAVPVFMMISGFVYAKSFQRSEIDCLKKAYRAKEIWKRMLRFIVPFSVAFALEILLKIISTGKMENIKSIIIRYLSGGEGPGSYYFPVMIQFVLFFPIIFLLVHNRGVQGLMICFFLNAGFEVLKTLCQMSVECYRILMFRYIFLIAIGACFAVKEQSLSGKWFVISFFIGVFFVWLFSYAPYQPQIIKFWKSTNFLTAFYIAPIFKFVMQNVSIRIKGLECIGRASFNIFLTQMVYYNFGGIRFVSNRAILLILNVIICCTVGILFYFIETPITKKIIKQIGLDT